MKNDCLHHDFADGEWEVEEFTTYEERDARVKTLEDLGYALGEDFIICD